MSEMSSDQALAHRTLLALMACVFAVFLVTGAALPTLPLHIHRDLGFSTFAVGLVSGAQFASSLLCRLWSGAIADRRGPKFAVSTGLLLTVLAGLLYLASMATMARPALSIGLLVVGRVLLGGAESFIMIGAQSWCLSLAGPGFTGRLIAWIGTAMFVALALGAPLGSVLFASLGFSAIGGLTLLGAVVSGILVLAIPARHRAPHALRAAGPVWRAVWMPGLAIAFPSLGYGVVITFAVLFFAQQGWQPAWFAFTAFALALIAARLCFGPLPDRLGGARTALIFILIHALGVALIGFATQPWLAFVGAAVAGFGYALVYPGLGMEAVARAPAGARGMAMGVYTAFIDLALGIFAPLLGRLGDLFGLARVFQVAAVLTLCAVPITLWLLRHPVEKAGEPAKTRPT